MRYRSLLCGIALVVAGPGRAAGPPLPSLWDELESPEPARAYRAVWALEAAGDEAVVFLEGRLRPVAGDPARLARLIAELDNDRFAVREEASRELERLGVVAEPALRQALRQAGSAEVRMRLTALLARLGPATPRAGSADELRLVRAVGVLEHIGTERARALLAALARGAPRARLTEDARDALRRLDRARGP
jgi:hypothetical protein